MSKQQETFKLAQKLLVNSNFIDLLELIESLKDVNIVDQNGNTLLHHIIISNSLYNRKYQARFKGETEFFETKVNEPISLINLLIEKGIDINARNN
ncbi:MAG: hypothetical protein J0H68_01370 [Sphingobacteriia bacterium]|nr:hypothetical protein [Sphingobacteriia bacterium]